MFFEIYQGSKFLSLDPAGVWYWRLKSRNGKVVADGAEGYSSKRAARRAICNVMAKIPTFRIDIREVDA